jgi:hypothetical protein
MTIECFLHLTTRTGVNAGAIPTKTAALTGCFAKAV